MKRVIDFSKKYKAKEDEVVVKANILFLDVDELREYDKVVALERDKEKFKGVDKDKEVVFVKTTTKQGKDETKQGKDETKQGKDETKQGKDETKQGDK